MMASVLCTYYLAKNTTLEAEKNNNIIRYKKNYEQESKAVFVIAYHIIERYIIL